MKKKLSTFFGIAALAIIAASLYFQGQVIKAVDFTIPSYSADFTLERTADNRSKLTVTETIVAKFSQAGTKHGITFTVPKKYENRAAEPVIKSVKNQFGVPLQRTVHEDWGSITLKIGDPDTYVKGEKTYIITYEIVDITRNLSDENIDEWYWDINTIGEGIKVGKMSVTLNFSEELAPLIRENPQCYEGTYGSTDKCELVKESATRYTINKDNLDEKEIVTVGFGFPANTFQAKPATWIDYYQAVVYFASPFTIPVAIILFFVFAVSFENRSKRRKELSFTPPQYIPPKDTSAYVVSELIGKRHRSIVATLIDLAVRHYISLYELDGDNDYEIEVKKDPSDLLEEEQEFLRDLFDGKTPSVGDTFSLASLKDNAKLRLRLADNSAKTRLAIRRTYKLRERKPGSTRFIIVWSLSYLLAAIVLQSIAFGIGALAMFMSKFGFKTPTDKGLEMLRYLNGYKKYIRAAEAERLKMLQGPDTAEKVGHSVDTGDTKQLIKLYERSLPYAILFGYEDEWSEALGGLYEKAHQTPDWYKAPGAGSVSLINGALLTNMVSSFNSSVRTNVSMSSSGGSGGSGSSGGGFSGGGGGGSSIGGW